MRVLIADDDYFSREILHNILSPLGECDVVITGEEALKAFYSAWKDGRPYDLLCLDILMPRLGGQEVLAQIRTVEADCGLSEEHAVNIIMTSGNSDAKNVAKAVRDGGCKAFLVKPIDRKRLLDEISGFCKEHHDEPLKKDCGHQNCDGETCGHVGRRVRQWLDLNGWTSHSSRRK